MISISYIMNVINGEPFIKYQLDSIYKHAYEIVIVEGAYKDFAHAANSEGSSYDSTLKIINEYPDPENKIKLIRKPGYFENRTDMCNELLKNVTGDVIWQVDVDEFYYSKTHEYVKNLFDTNYELDRVSFFLYEMWGSVDYYIAGYDVRDLENVYRVHRFSKGDYWVSQRPPLLNNILNEKKEIRKEISGYKLKEEGHFMMHGSVLFEKQIQDKYKFYKGLWWNITKPTKWLREVWYSYNNKFNTAGFKDFVTYLKRRDFELSNDLTLLWNDVTSKRYLGFVTRDCTDIEKYLSSKKYPIYVEIAENINNYFNIKKKQNFKERFKFNIILIYKIVTKLDHHTKYFALKVLFILNAVKQYQRLLPYKQKLFKSNNRTLSK